MALILKAGTGSKQVSLPADIIKKHIRLADGDKFRVLLYILNGGNEEPKAIAKALKISEEDAEDCVSYWLLTGVLCSSEEKPGEAPAEKPERFVPAAKADNKPVTPVKEDRTEPVIEYSRPSQLEIVTRMEEDKKIATLFKELQGKLGKTIGYDGMCTFLLLHDRFGLSVEVIYMIVDYCVGIGKSGYSYIESVGKSWALQEIDTIEKAAEKIENLSKANSFWKKFVVSTGISNPKPTAKQTEFIEKWLNVLKIPYDLIVYAYELMAEKTGKLSFSYMDTILMSWSSAGYKKVDDVKNAEKAKSDAAKSKAASSDASYDLEKFRQDSISKKLKYERKS